MIFFQRFYLDREKDIVVDLYMEGDRMIDVIRTPNHHTGNLITNLARLCALKTSLDENGLKVIRDEVPCYVNGDNEKMYILRLGGTKIANIYPDGRVEPKASIPAISKTLMSQTKDYRLSVEETIVKTYIRGDCKFRTDLHTHMNGNLPPDILIALGIIRQIRYPYYYIKKLGLKCTPEQLAALETARAETEKRLGDEGLAGLTGKHRNRRIDDYTFINFAELILGNPEAAAENIARIRNSLTIPKDGQAVFADLEKVYLYRYVFTKGQEAENRFSGINVEGIADPEVRAYASRMLRDRRNDRTCRNTLYQDLLLWIARVYERYGITYAEISDTALLSGEEGFARLRQIHEIMPEITRQTGVLLRFLTGIRRVPLTIVRDRSTPADYLAENLRRLRVIAEDPYVAGSDILGEEINDILELRDVIRQLTGIAGEVPGFVIRIHAGENDSLRENVAGSIRCVREALAPGQPMPAVRIGHGLYTSSLQTARGRKLLEEMRENHITLEFQITSNVRLNNLSTLRRYPLRQYLHSGVRCVQGTDGGALYGTNSIDEELSLEKLLGLTQEELRSMRQAEDAILKESLRCFEQKRDRFREARAGMDVEQYYSGILERTPKPAVALWQGDRRISAAEALADRLSPLPEEGTPVVICGGSFNRSRRHTALSAEDQQLIDALLDRADPDRVYFVVGHTLADQEGYLVRKAAGRFRLFAIVPNQLTQAETEQLRASGAGILISIESSGIGLYKSFSYEVFRHRPSVVLAFEGNSAALNLIQQARNSSNKHRIFINPRSRGLKEKARQLEGYIRPLGSAEEILGQAAALPNTARKEK